MQMFFLEYSSSELASTHLDCVHVFLFFLFFFLVCYLHDGISFLQPL